MINAISVPRNENPMLISPYDSFFHFITVILIFSYIKKVEHPKRQDFRLFHCYSDSIISFWLHLIVYLRTAVGYKTYYTLTENLALLCHKGFLEVKNTRFVQLIFLLNLLN